MQKTWRLALSFHSYLDDAWLRYDVVCVSLGGILLSDLCLPILPALMYLWERMDVAFLDDRTSEGSKAEPPKHWHVHLFLYPEDES